MWPNPQFPANLITFTEEIINGKLPFLYSALGFMWIIGFYTNILIIYFWHIEKVFDKILLKKLYYNEIMRDMYGMVSIVFECGYITACLMA